MCGLTAAYSQRLSPADIDTLKLLMYLSDIRGGYGAGEVSVNKKGSYHVIKDNFTAADLTETKIFNDRMKDDVSLVIGHSRWPTKGSQTKANAHPHIFHNVIGVHNGTFRSILEEGISETENDSKTFFDAVSKFGIQEAVSKSTGAYALMWVDKETKEFRVLRNHERPLFIAYVRPPYKKEEEFRTVFVSSESRMLAFALDRRGILADSKIKEVPVNKMICFPHSPENFILPQPNVVDLPECKKYFYPKATWRGDYSSDCDWDARSSHKSQNVVPFVRGRVIFRNGNFYDVLASGAEVSWSKQRTAQYVKNASLTQEDTKNVSPPFLLTHSTDPCLLPLEKEISRVQNRSGSSIGAEDRHTIPSPDDPAAVPDDFTDPRALMWETKRNFYVSFQKYEELLSKGCAFCSDVPDVGADSRTKPHFFSSTEFYCHACMSNEDALLLANIPLNEKRA